MVVHVCNPSYSGGRDGKYQGSRPAWAKNSRDPISTNKLGVVECASDSSYMGGVNRGNSRTNWKK
jgi:hypothetical protein